MHRARKSLGQPGPLYRASTRRRVRGAQERRRPSRREADRPPVATAARPPLLLVLCRKRDAGVILKRPPAGLTQTAKLTPVFTSLLTRLRRVRNRGLVWHFGPENGATDYVELQVGQLPSLTGVIHSYLWMMGTALDVDEEAPDLGSAARFDPGLPTPLCSRDLTGSDGSRRRAPPDTPRRQARPDPARRASRSGKSAAPLPAA